MWTWVSMIQTVQRPTHAILCTASTTKQNKLRVRWLFVNMWLVPTWIEHLFHKWRLFKVFGNSYGILFMFAHPKVQCLQPSVGQVAIEGTGNRSHSCRTEHHINTNLFHMSGIMFWTCLPSCKNRNLSASSSLLVHRIPIKTSEWPTFTEMGTQLRYIYSFQFLTQ